MTLEHKMPRTADCSSNSLAARLYLKYNVLCPSFVWMIYIYCLLDDYPSFELEKKGKIFKVMSCKLP